jgi:hypothetical protein
MSSMSSAMRRELRGLDPETVRTRLELGMSRRLQGHLGAGWRPEAPAYEHTSAALEVDAWLGSLTAEARVGRLADEARRVLGVDREVEVHPTRERLAAAHRAEGGPLIVSLHWRALAGLDDDALLAVLGHELGHHLAHNGARPEGPDPRFVYFSLYADRSSEIREVAAAYSRAAELSADRFALLACQDLDAVLRLFSALSDDPAARGRDPAELLAASRERAEGLLASRKRATGDSHPEMSVRVHAAWMFAQSDVYYRLTGRGAGTRSLLDVDMILARMVGPSDDAILPFDEPTWMDDVGEAIYEKSGALGKSVARRAAQLAVTLHGARAAPIGGDAVAGADEPDVDRVELDDLEARFAALERSVGQGRLE